MAAPTYPGFTSAVVDVLRKECVKSSEAIRCAAARIVEQLTMDASLYVYYMPDDACRNVTVRFSDRRYGTNVVNGSDVFVNALKAAFIRHLPDPERLKSVVASDTLHLSTFTETESVRDKRRDIDERIARVRAATRELILKDFENGHKHVSYIIRLKISVYQNNPQKVLSLGHPDIEVARKHCRVA